MASKKVSLEGSISIVRLVELGIEHVHAHNNTIEWPEMCGDAKLPVVHGVLLLFDVMNLETFENIPRVLGMSFSMRCSSLCRICLIVVNR